MSRLDAVALARSVRISADDLPACVVYGDERLLARAFDNVLENAVRYNRPGGAVTITAAVHDSGDEAEPVTVAIRVEEQAAQMETVLDQLAQGHVRDSLAEAVEAEAHEVDPLGRGEDPNQWSGCLGLLPSGVDRDDVLDGRHISDRARSQVSTYRGF